MAELVASRVGVVTGHAMPEALDGLEPIDGAVSCRVAPDELMLVTEPKAVERVLGAVSAALDEADPGGLAIDATDGWSATILRGDDARIAFSRLSPLELRGDGFLQGDLLRLPARVIARDREVLVLVPAMWEAWFRGTATERCPEISA